MAGTAAPPEGTETESSDIEGAELSPLTPRPAVRSSRTQRWTAALVLVAVAGGVALLVSNLLGDAALFFYNADEAVERRDELASQRFYLQGTPLSEPTGTFWEDRPVLSFPVGFDGAVVNVVHTGDPPELFQPGVPVVLEGAWQPGPGPGPVSAGDGWHFASDPDAGEARQRLPRPRRLRRAHQRRRGGRLAAVSPTGSRRAPLQP